MIISILVDGATTRNPLSSRTEEKVMPACMELGRSGGKSADTGAIGPEFPSSAAHCRTQSVCSSKNRATQRTVSSSPWTTWTTKAAVVLGFRLFWHLQHPDLHPVSVSWFYRWWKSDIRICNKNADFVLLVETKSIIALRRVLFLVGKRLRVQ